MPCVLRDSLRTPRKSVLHPYTKVSHFRGMVYVICFLMDILIMALKIFFPQNLLNSLNIFNVRKFITEYQKVLLASSPRFPKFIKTSAFITISGTRESLTHSLGCYLKIQEDSWAFEAL
jgi:hypothetical protein